MCSTSARWPQLSAANPELGAWFDEMPALSPGSQAGAPAGLQPN